VSENVLCTYASVSNTAKCSAIYWCVVLLSRVLHGYTSMLYLVVVIYVINLA